ncbi:MAG: PKD domain-containing protein [Chitinophagales bacterium]
MKYFIYLLLFQVLILFQVGKASHLVGGDFYYDCLGNNQYRFTLNVYKDCNALGPNVADFDDPAFIGVYEGSNHISTEYIFLDDTTKIPAIINNPCLQAPPDVCVEEGTYEFIINLPNSTAGYKLVYQRCCRNHTIVNLNQPSNQGATFSIDIPPSNLVTCNSSPRFNEFPPIAICANDPLVFDHSATDPDGDNIVYELCAPIDGGSQVDPRPSPPGPPYNNVQYSAGFSAGAPLTATPPLSIDPNTGILSGTPTSVGQYVVGVCAKEYRNGILIGETRRDFQFNVTDCTSNVEASVPTIDNDPVASLGTEGVFVYECQDFTVNFINNSSNGTTYDWDFGVSGTTQDQSSDFEPSYTYPDTGAYIVRLIVNQGFPCADTTDVVVRIYPIFTTDFSFVDICRNEAAEFEDLTQSSYGTINNWEWDFGDGNTSNIPNPTHQYSSDGTYTVRLISENSKGCRDEMEKELTVLNTPNTDFEISPTCIDEPINFNNTTTISSGSISSYEWIFSNGQNSTQNNTTQTYNSLGNQSVLLIAESNSGCKDSLLRTFTVHPLPTVSISNDTSICEDEKVVLNASGGTDYSWTPTTGLSDAGIQNPIAQPLTSTEYTVLVTDINECTSSAATFITVFPKPNTSAGVDTFVCLGDSITLHASGGVSFRWSPAFLFNDPNEISPTISPDSSLYLNLESLSDKGCKNTDQIYLEVQKPIEKPQDIGDKSICLGDTLFFNIPEEKYISWESEEAFNNPNSSNTFFNGTESTSVLLKMSNDCFRDSFEFYIQVNPLPEVVSRPPKDSIFRDEFTSITAEGAYEYSWTPEAGITSNNNSSIEVSPFNSTLYVVEGTDQNGCKASDSTFIFVEVKNLIVVPSAFTPNNDGLNDIFRIIRTLNIQSIDAFEIFNRWGQRVFFSNTENVGWDGFFKGELQDLGVYVYKIAATTKDGDKIVEKGNLTLIR